MIMDKQMPIGNTEQTTKSTHDPMTTGEMVKLGIILYITNELCHLLVYLVLSGAATVAGQLTQF